MNTDTFIRGSDNTKSIGWEAPAAHVYTEKQLKNSAKDCGKIST